MEELLRNMCESGKVSLFINAVIVEDPSDHVTPPLQSLTYGSPMGHNPFEIISIACTM